MKTESNEPQQTSAEEPRLSLRQRLYLAGRVEGKSQEAAVLEAGYQPSVARSACRIENADVREEFKRIIRSWVDPEKLGQRIAEGLDAMETQFFQHEGTVMDMANTIAWDVTILSDAPRDRGRGPFRYASGLTQLILDISGYFARYCRDVIDCMMKRPYHRASPHPSSRIGDIHKAGDYCH